MEVKRNNKTIRRTKMKTKTTIRSNYDKENDILAINWNGQIEYSREICDNQIILDFDKNNKVVGIEIFDFAKELEKSSKQIEKLFKIMDKAKQKKKRKRVRRLKCG